MKTAIFSLAFLFLAGCSRQAETPAPAALPVPTPVLDSRGLPIARDDVKITLNSSRELSALQSPIKTDAPIRPDVGKVFLLCNVTVAFKGTGSLQASGALLRLEASNHQIYGASLHTVDAEGLNPLLATLLPSGTTTGDVVFEVEQGAKPVILEMIRMPYMPALG